jgi:hypothetical protein
MSRPWRIARLYAALRNFKYRFTVAIFLSTIMSARKSSISFVVMSEAMRPENNARNRAALILSLVYDRFVRRLCSM